MEQNLGSAEARNQYWRANLKGLIFFLVAWFSVSFGCGILFRETLDKNFPKIGEAPFGFWMSQQGSIICFVILLVLYAVFMGRLDARFESQQGKES